MTFLYEWIKQIILFILIGTVLEMLLPSNRLRKYVHFVFGLLFLLILAKPIFYLFQTDIVDEISFIEQQMAIDDGKVDATKLLIEKQKEDIQAEQVAYIWNELAEYYIAEGNAVLEDDFAVQIKHIYFENEREFEEQPGSFSKVVVSIAPHIEGRADSIDMIEPIEIKLNEKKQSTAITTNIYALEHVLREKWQLEENISVEIVWEGGTP